jgi:hypothetical protein
VKTITPIKVRSRNLTTVPVSMERSSSPASSARQYGRLAPAKLLARGFHGERRVVLEHAE